MAYRIALTLALLATSGPASAEPDVGKDRPALRLDAPDACMPKDLLGRVEGLVGLHGEQLAAKLVRVAARIRQRPEGDWHAQVAVQTVAGSGERAFEAEDCRSLVDGIALVVALTIDPAIQEPAGAIKPPQPAMHEPVGATAATAARPRLALRPLLGAHLGTLPEVGLTYGLAAGVLWPHVRIEADGRSAPQQEIHNASGHGARIRLPLGFGGRACLQSAPSGWVEPAACAGAIMNWLRSTGLGIASPETHDSLAVALTVGAALGVRLRDWLWLRVDGFFALSAKRPRFEIDGREEVYRAPLLSGFLGGGIEFRL